MKRISVILPVLFCLMFISCNEEIASLGNSKIHIITVGYDYLSATDVGYSKGMVNDALEVGLCLSNIYEAKHIEYETSYMVAYSKGSDRTCDNYPTSDNVLKKVKRMDVKKDDLIVFYYAGHGDKESFYLAPDTEDSTDCSLLKITDLYRELENKGCASIVLLDTCAAGAMSSLPSKEQYIDQALKNYVSQEFEDISVIASCKVGELSEYADAEKYKELQEHGFFTLALLEVLGWDHDMNVKRATRISVCGKETGVKGYVKSIPKELNTEDILKKILEIWPTMQGRLLIQTPVKSYDHAFFYLIPDASNTSEIQLPADAEDEPSEEGGETHGGSGFDFGLPVDPNKKYNDTTKN